MIMEDPTASDECKSEAEDFPLSDTENATPMEEEEEIPLSIDYNARVVSSVIENFNEYYGDNCDMHFVNRTGAFGRRGSDTRFHTSVEDLSASDEEEKCYKTLTLQSVDLDGVACISSKKENTLSTLNYSHTGFKDDYSIDAEMASDEDAGDNAEDKFFARSKHKSLPPGLTFGGFSAKATSPAVSAGSYALKSLNIKNAYSKTLLIKDSDIHDLYDEQESPLMTCLEFLKSECTDDCHTDAEDLSVGSLEDIAEASAQNGHMDLGIPMSMAALPSDNGHGVLFYGGRRRSSAAEFLTEDETLDLENFSSIGRKKLKKTNRWPCDKNDLSDDESCSDEEQPNMGKKKWTETDDTGGVRQITQIKTETSIKLEGEGDDLGIDSDDIVSRTTTTTTRIVTTVTTDGEQESHEDQQILSDGGDDLRHSVEVILNQFMSSDSDATKPEDSTTEHDE